MSIILEALSFCFVIRWRIAFPLVAQARRRHWRLKQAGSRGRRHRYANELRVLESREWMPRGIDAKLAIPQNMPAGPPFLQ